MENTKPTLEDLSLFAVALSSVIQNANAGFVFSPISIFECLAMVALGASDSCLLQMKKALCCSGDLAAHPAAEYFTKAYSLWAKNSISKSFQSDVQTKFLSDVFPLTNAAPINAWCGKKTNGLILDIVKDFHIKNSDAVLVSAIYFKGPWQTPFPKHLTKERAFKAKGKDVQISMMNRVGKYPAYFKNDDVEAIRLNYAGEKCCSMIFMTEKPLSAELLSEVYGGLLDVKKVAVGGVQGSLTLPKFQMRWNQELGAALKGLGMTEAFSTPKAFPNVTQEGFMLQLVIHEAVLKVNEDGTEAAAVTVAAGRGGGPPKVVPNVFEMVVDKPFYFTINHSYKGKWELDFIAYVCDPQKF